MEGERGAERASLPGGVIDLHQPHRALGQWSQWARALGLCSRQPLVSALALPLNHTLRVQFSQMQAGLKSTRYAKLCSDSCMRYINHRPNHWAQQWPHGRQWMDWTAIFPMWKPLRVTKHLFHKSCRDTIWSRDLVCRTVIRHRQLDGII